MQSSINSTSFSRVLLIFVIVFLLGIVSQMPLVSSYGGNGNVIVSGLGANCGANEMLLGLNQAGSNVSVTDSSGNRGYYGW